MNRRGIAPLLLIIGLIVVVAIVLLGSFVDQIKWFLLAAILIFMIFTFSRDGKITGNEWIGVFAITGLSAFFLFGGFGVLQTQFQTLSISDASYDDGSDKVIVFASTQGAEALEIVFSPDTLNGFLDDDGVGATQTSRLTAEVTKSSIDFPYVTNNDNPVKSYIRLGQTNNAIGSAVAECRDNGFPTTDFAVFEGPDFLSRKVGCYEYIDEGFINGFNTGTVQADNEIRFILDGQSKTISANNNQVNFNGAKVEWTGNLVGNQFIGAPQYQLYRIANSIRLVQPNADSKANTAFSNFINCFDFGGNTGTNTFDEIQNFDECSTQYEAAINPILVDKETEYVNNIQDVESIDTISNGRMEVSLREPTFIPTFRIELDADKVGIVQFEGDPEIVQCANDVTLDGSGSAKSTIRVRNIGDEDGFFRFETSTNNNQVDCRITDGSVNQGQTKTFDVFYSGAITSEDDVEGTCNIRVFDSNSPSNQDTCNFDITVEFNSFTSECDDEGLTTCTSDGSSILTCEDGFLIPTLCKFGCEEITDGAVCAEESASGDGQVGCPFGQTLVKETETIGKGPFGIGKYFGFTEEITTERCETSDWVIWSIFGFVVLSLGIAWISVNRPKNRRKKR